MCRNVFFPLHLFKIIIVHVTVYIMKTNPFELKIIKGGEI